MNNATKSTPVRLSINRGSRFGVGAIYLDNAPMALGFPRRLDGDQRSAWRVAHRLSREMGGHGAVLVSRPVGGVTGGVQPVLVGSMTSEGR